MIALHPASEIEYRLPVARDKQAMSIGVKITHLQSNTPPKRPNAVHIQAALAAYPVFSTVFHCIMLIPISIRLALACDIVNEARTICELCGLNGSAQKQAGRVKRKRYGK
jgi:hypothetical protein